MRSSYRSSDTRWALAWLAGLIGGPSALLVELVSSLPIAIRGTGHRDELVAFLGMRSHGVVLVVVAARPRIVLFSDVRTGERT